MHGVCWKGLLYSIHFIDVIRLIKIIKCKKKNLKKNFIIFNL